MSISFGYTGITWPKDECEHAVEVMAKNGFKNVEFFNFNLKEWEDNGGVSAMAAKYGVRLYSCYCSYDIVNSENHDAAIAQAREDAALIAKNGGEIMTMGGGGVNRKTTMFSDYGDYAIKTINEIATIADQNGVKACFHPHTGTPVETREEIFAVMDGVDADVVGFAPDIAQIQKGGTDPMEVLRRYPKRIDHVHFKDYGGTVEFDPETGREYDSTGFLCYMPLGMGVVDLKGVLSFLEENQFSGYCMVELDGGFFGPDVREGRVTPPCTNDEAVAISARWIQDAGYGL